MRGAMRFATAWEARPCAKSLARPLAPPPAATTLAVRRGLGAGVDLKKSRDRRTARPQPFSVAEARQLSRRVRQFNSPAGRASYPGPDRAPRTVPRMGYVQSNRN